MQARTTLIVGVIALLSLAAVAVAGAKVDPPANVAAAGEIVFCTDPTYPPEAAPPGPKPGGPDIDIGAAIAGSMTVKVEWRNVGFDGIVAALLTKKCDAILAAMTDTPQRRKQLDFAHCLIVGMSLMVKKGNAHHITGLASLSGL